MQGTKPATKSASIARRTSENRARIGHPARVDRVAHLQEQRDGQRRDRRQRRGQHDGEEPQPQALLHGKSLRASWSQAAAIRGPKSSTSSAASERKGP